VRQGIAQLSKSVKEVFEVSVAGPLVFHCDGRPREEMLPVSMKGFSCRKSCTISVPVTEEIAVTSRRRNRFVVSIVVLTVSLTLLSQAGPAYQYTASVLNFPSVAWGLHINSTGQILGMGIGPNQYAFIYQNGAIQVIDNLPPLPNGTPLPENYPLGNNNAGQVIGFCQDPDFFYQIGYLRNVDGSLVNFYSLTGSLFCAPSALNNSGTVVGGSAGRNAPFSVNPQGYVYQNGNLTFLGSFEGYALNGAQCVNDAGQIVAT
jgi:hypothetical protein